MIMAAFKPRSRLLRVQVIRGPRRDVRQVLDSRPAGGELVHRDGTVRADHRSQDGWLTDPKYAAAARKAGWRSPNKTNSAGARQELPGHRCGTGRNPSLEQQFYATLRWAGHCMVRAPLCGGPRAAAKRLPRRALGTMPLG